MVVILMECGSTKIGGLLGCVCLYRQLHKHPVATLTPNPCSWNFVCLYPVSSYEATYTELAKGGKMIVSDLRVGKRSLMELGTVQL